MAIADAIAKARPEVVGLQEVSEIDIDLPGAPFGLPSDIHIDLDFLAILQAALAARGLDYDVAAIVENTDASPPLPIPGATVRVVDHDVILVDADRVDVTATVEQNYLANVGPLAPGVTLIRGFVGVTGEIRGKTYSFFNTHLEADLAGNELGLLRAAQAGELLAALGGAERVVLMGDFNDEPGTLMHQAITGAGFADLWTALRHRAPGFTCCHTPDLSNRRPRLDQRIDYIFSRGIGHPVAGVLGRIDRLGEVPADRVPGPEHKLWPSDHVGLVADLLVPPARGHVAAGGLD